MSREIIREWHFWIASIVTGAGMAFAYDLIRLFRRLVRHGRIAVDLEDWTACFVVSFTLLYYGNNGVIRFAAVLGAAVGMAGYVFTVGRFFVKISFGIIDKTVGRCHKKYVQWKYRLTHAIFGNKIKLCAKRKKGKGETGDGSSEAKKRKTKAKKNARVSPREK